MMEPLGGISEVGLRLTAFLGIFLAMAALERLLPRRRLRVAKLQRWVTNLSIVALDSLLVRIMAGTPAIIGAAAMPLVAVAAALMAEQKGWGLFNGLDWPIWIEIVVSLVVLDFAIWFQHLASHKVAVLWRLHRMHHADLDIDVTTALRFHPIEIGLSMLYKIVWVLALGPAAAAVVLFEVILNGCALFNHANVRLPLALDSALRMFVVTPDMHRVHHSTEAREHHANFGFNLSLWDRLFSTYVANPAAGHENMTIGLPEYQADGPARLGYSLMIPFRNGRRDAGTLRS